MRFQRKGSIAILVASEKGLRLGNYLKQFLPQAELYTTQTITHAHQIDCAKEPEGSPLSNLTPLQSFVRKLFEERYAAIIGIMATGIMVRALAPSVRSKYEDPAVVVVDDAGRFAISLLSGHEGGANALAEDISEFLAATPVITTGSEASRNLIVGIGCRKNIPPAALRAAIEQLFQEKQLELANIRLLATIDLKRHEPAIQNLAHELSVPLQVVWRSRIKTLQDVLRQQNFVENTVGVASVCVSSALLASPHATLIVPKTTFPPGITLAVAKDACGLWGLDPEAPNT